MTPFTLLSNHYQAVDTFIYFANIRADYKWAYLGKTLVYSYNKVSFDLPLPPPSFQCYVLLMKVF